MPQKSKLTVKNVSNYSITNYLSEYPKPANHIYKCLKLANEPLSECLKLANHVLFYGCKTADDGEKTHSYVVNAWSLFKTIVYSVIALGSSFPS